MTYYKLFDTYTEAEAFVAMLEEQGEKKENINIVMKAGETNHPSDMSKEALLNTDTKLDDSPVGTTRALGAAGTFIAGISASLALVAAGPIAAIIAGGTAGALTLAAVLSGLGVPDEEHFVLEKAFEAGQVLVQVESNNPDIEEYFDTRSAA